MPSSRKLDREYVVDWARTQMASEVTNMLIFVIVFNTVMTTILTFLLGFGVIELGNATYISFLVSSIGIIGVTSLIVRLLPEKNKGADTP